LVGQKGNDILRRLLTFAGIGCGGLLVLVVTVAVLAAAFGVGTNTGTQDKDGQKAEPGEENQPKEEAEQAEDAGDIAVRISGTQGVEYSGSYGTTQGQTTVDGTLGARPDEYEVDAQTGRLQIDVVSASFQKRSPGPGQLRVEIVSDGDVQASQETSAEFGVVSTVWSPQAPQN
jgi:hypothetical protein